MVLALVVLLVSALAVHLAWILVSDGVGMVLKVVLVVGVVFVVGAMFVGGVCECSC